ncbi:MAG: hypothetical protein V9G98_08900 [Candidatus Competibacter sp.]
MLESILTENDCASCKRCCRFEADELIDAPLFTEQSSLEIVIKTRGGVTFTQVQGLWRINLIPDATTSKYRCPMLDDMHGCILKEKRPLDCQSWPFYLTQNDAGYMVAISPYCPITNRLQKKLLADVARREVMQPLLNMIRHHPESITFYRDEFFPLFYVNLPKK